MQLSRWYRDNRFCGRCGGEMARDLKERMLYCPRCKNTVYPKISPCIITGITDGDWIEITDGLTEGDTIAYIPSSNDSSGFMGMMMGGMGGGGEMVVAPAAPMGG